MADTKVPVQDRREYAVQVLDNMGLDQIANWLRILPEDRWQELFIAQWPTLAKKCGIDD